MLRLQFRALMILVTVAATAAALFGWTEFLPVAIVGLIATAVHFLAEAIARRNAVRRHRLPLPKIPVVVDGQDVIRWKEGVSGLDTLREVLVRLAHCGFAPNIVFDENAGDFLPGRYPHDLPLAQHFGLPRNCVLVAHKGTPADAFILASARDLGARIVTNDRYRDWANRHPEVHEPGRLIRGGYRDGALWLDLDAVPT